jgi:hypothetical protein
VGGGSYFFDSIGVEQNSKTNKALAIPLESLSKYGCPNYREKIPWIHG